MQRRRFIGQASLLGAGSMFAPQMLWSRTKDFPVVRVPVGERKFSSPAIENAIVQMKKKLKDPELGWLFENCFPNTLDTTVEFEMINGKPDTYVITGDIDAMWLRDSTAQVWPYLPFLNKDKNLNELIKGVIRRQTLCILLDPYANAFFKDVNKISEWKDDRTEMKPGIHERKWEIDSLCYPIRLAYGYWRISGDTTVFDNEWKEAMRLVIKTFREQQRLDGNGPYKFERRTTWATDGVPLGGYGYPTKKVGLIHSMFRPSDDATIFPYLIPSNVFALTALDELSQIADRIEKNGNLWKQSSELMTQLGEVINRYGLIQHPQHGLIIPYEVDGFGNFTLMDDANIPSLLAIPYFSRRWQIKSEVYNRTRKLLLSDANPFFFKGKVAEGIGGPHAGIDQIWPLSIIMRAMTSKEDAEIKQNIQWLKTTHAGTGFMHESFHKDDSTKFTRKWFAWANTLFGELLLKVMKERPHLLT